MGDLPPYEAFPIGGTNSVRGYSEGGVGSGRNYAAGTAELHFPLFKPLQVRTPLIVWTLPFGRLLQLSNGFPRDFRTVPSASICYACSKDSYLLPTRAASHLLRAGIN